MEFFFGKHFLRLWQPHFGGGYDGYSSGMYGENMSNGYIDDMNYYGYADYGYEESRLLNYGYNVSTFAQGLTYVLGTMLLLSVFSLLLYYAVATAPIITGRSTYSGRQDYYHDDKKRYNQYAYLRILDQLDQVFTKYGVTKEEEDKKSQGCRVKLVCEVYLKDALTVNRGAASAIAGVISKLTPDKVRRLPTDELLTANELLTAANRGRHLHDCSSYSHTCPQRTLKDLNSTKDESKKT